mmetsp:Transcript_130608/g.194555  ORF Transcript_130608/g.194555 Transcript_130608/m.194555 type:complete len:233 (-) Transcript_130608:150-848(-)|eukprot:CAMPEP_0117050284 /NCGR_PEP_ID=MMETSP0472-20121206/34712_1 /TAXON_ID=693140 ORGANISM="Tiarina fusus, Strain LIS" /NCGR_SAMPLE_ID=MMETSP0472 /ASSEMBLY_ACC=CAM_ASM_000603 /LENGTH=232 /DNA_ID=CAMNT_0004763995 /DNA_START=90 /DNA_END=788 /DNA_ORIENTATION=+
MVLFRCFSAKKTQPENEDPKSPSTKKRASAKKTTAVVEEGQTWTDDDDSTLNSGTQDDPIYRGLYRGISGNSPSLAEATTGENSSARFSDNSSLSTSNDPMLDANNNRLGRNLLLGPQNDENDDDDDGGSLFLEKGLYPQHHTQQTTTYSVTLPPGKVGMVLNTPPEGATWSAPMVYQIKPNCPVRHQVAVGDRLLSVDGEDCSYMSAVEASRFLSGKVNQSRRELVFARTR